VVAGQTPEVPAFAAFTFIADPAATTPGTFVFTVPVRRSEWKVGLGIEMTVVVAGTTANARDAFNGARSPVLSATETVAT
jgi:hypothetical protein